jgi:repressor LexA
LAEGLQAQPPKSNVTNISKLAEVSWQVEIPFSGAVAAGKPIEVYLEGETIFVPDWMIIRGKSNFALRVQGDSMIDDHVLDQDLLVVHRVDPTTVRSDSRVVVDLDDEGATFKRWTHKIQEYVTLTPSNKHLSPRTVHVSKIRGVYRVTGLLRKP